MSEAAATNLETHVNGRQQLNENQHKALLFVLLSYFTAAVTFLLVIYYSFFEFNSSVSLVLFLFTVAILINAGLYLYHRELDLHTIFYLILALTTPFLLHIIIYKGGNSPILWGVVTPIAALFLQNYKKSIIWLVSYIILTSVILILDGAYTPGSVRRLITLNEFISQVNFIGFTILGFSILIYFVRRIEKLGDKNNILLDENSKSEELINQLLPEEIAMRLKNESRVITDSFDEVTVLFADMVGFTELSSKITPIELVDLLNVIFSSLDRIVDEYGMEKIKTMGDAYMAASGIPSPREDHAEVAAQVALKFMDEVRKFSHMSGMNIKVRIGLHTGPVVAGVIGINKTIYDLWGDTVNVAARMEHHGVPDKIQVTRVTYNLLKDKFSFVPRGQIEVKGKGPMDAYILIDRKKSVVPNVLFNVATTY